MQRRTGGAIHDIIHAGYTKSMTANPSHRPLNVLLFPVGSAGDVYPHLGLDRALLERGHRVTLLTSGYFREAAEREGFEFVDLMPEEKFLRLAGNPLLWDPLRGAKAIFELYDIESIREAYQATVDHYEEGSTVAVTSAIGFAARIAQERIGIPLVTVDLQPMVLWSQHESPVLPGIPRGKYVPGWLKNAVYRMAERFLLDPMICPTLNEFRKELDLPPIRGLTKWWHSPQAILGLWPEWYGPVQPDWPSQLRLTGFPLWTEKANEPLPDDVESFLAAGDPPIVFTPGTANMFGHEFFRESLKACQQLGRRGMFFSKFDEHIPDELPETVRHFRYAAFQTLLPRVAAIVHHGGIGTTANAMAAGIPQLIMPLSHDQPDNAHRLKNLGIGDWLVPKRYRGEKVAAKLKYLLTDEGVKAATKGVASRFETNGTSPFEVACDVVESLV